MSSPSISDGLKSKIPETTLLVHSQPVDAYDVVIRFISAENVPKTDIVGHSDPYFIAKIDDNITHTSAVVENTATPKWDDEEWIVRNIPLDAKLFVSVYDKDDDQPLDDYIGQFEVINLINYHAPDGGHDILGLSGHKHGSFHLSIQSMRSSEESQQLPRYTFDGPCRYFRHDSLSVGRLTMFHADCIYSTWKISMRRLSFFFPPYQRQHWNTKYKLARAIFGKCPLSIAPRTTLKIAHKALYGRTVKHSENGRLNDANDLWKYVFTDKFTKKIEPCVYTYVIDDHAWRFSEVGSRLLTDIASKHALLANGCEYVRYAGEFHLRPKHGWDKIDDEWELVIDNGSGTYAPNPDLLKNLKELLVFNFPGLNVVTYDQEDPKLKESKDQMKVATEENKHKTIVIDELAKLSPLSISSNIQ
ncbi:unnamed protein product [Adineta steineri]|uniref:C2 domain-containing protein n=1 Tax=Adineta steineri TaxID=433720 RepID=A0A813Q5A3_9BILA|nr:unnamed protein product [Adineta steineri]CAF0797817.1 unnamed protein product [Adineta steineri]